MRILIAGPYSATTTEKRRQNLNAINKAALAVFRKGHIPIVGLNVALPVIGKDSSERQQYDDIMRISSAVAERCDAVLRIASSPGADRKVQLLSALGKPVFGNIDEIPIVNS